MRDGIPTLLLAPWRIGPAAISEASALLDAVDVPNQRRNIEARDGALRQFLRNEPRVLTAKHAQASHVARPDWFKCVAALDSPLQPSSARLPEPEGEARHTAASEVRQRLRHSHPCKSNPRAPLTYYWTGSVRIESLIHTKCCLTCLRAGQEFWHCSLQDVALQALAYHLPYYRSLLYSYIFLEAIGLFSYSGIILARTWPARQDHSCERQVRWPGLHNPCHIFGVSASERSELVRIEQRQTHQRLWDCALAAN